MQAKRDRVCYWYCHLCPGHVSDRNNLYFMTRKLKAGMVGGGRDAFIGGVHRLAMRLDGKIELVAGAFSSNPEKAKLSGEDLLLDSKRVYAD